MSNEADAPVPPPRFVVYPAVCTVLHLALLLAVRPVLSQVVLNEICAENGGAVVSPGRTSPDYIELYNTSASAVNLSAWTQTWRVSTLLDMRVYFLEVGASMQLIVPPGQGHNMWPGFFQNQELVDFVKAHAGPNITLLSPLDYQVIQRGSKDLGSLSISGELAGFTAKKSTIEARLWVAGQPGKWRQLAVDSTRRRFEARWQDPTRTLPGNIYHDYLEKLIRASRREIGWKAPWFVAQASYHVPGDEASPDIRAAQASLWKNGLALEGPDSDAIKGDFRENGGQGVHFSGPGLREHAARWVEKIAPWLEQRMN